MVKGYSKEYTKKLFFRVNHNKMNYILAQYRFKMSQQGLRIKNKYWQNKRPPRA